MFLIELTETSFGDPVAPEGILTRRHGEAPPQLLQEDEEITPIVISEELEEEFYGEDGFEEEDLDMEGFDILD